MLSSGVWSVTTSFRRSNSSRWTWSAVDSGVRVLIDRAFRTAISATPAALSARSVEFVIGVL